MIHFNNYTISSSVLPLQLLEQVDPHRPEDHHQGDVDQGYHLAPPQDLLNVPVELLPLLS